MKKTLISIVTLLSLCLANFASAAFIQMTGPVSAGSSPSTEDGPRGISFLADETFSISSLGIFGDIIATDYTVAVRSSTDGTDLGGVLSSNTEASGGQGQSWQDISLSFTFNQGAYYAIQWGPASSVDWINSLSFYRDSGLPTDVGVATLIDGYRENFDGSGTGFSNVLHPQIRVNLVATVSEPAAIVLLLLGLFRIGAIRKK